MDNFFLWSDLWLGELCVEYLDVVRDDDRFGCCVNDLEAAVVLECRDNGENFAAVEVPISAGVWFGMDDDWDAEGS